jgi:DNA transformation protein and related proteins
MGKTTTSKDDSFVEYICDQLMDFEIVTYKPMFGGYGLYCGDAFFGIVFDGRLYFKTNEQTEKKYLSWESEPFQTEASQKLISYYQVPVDIVENASKLVEWAEEAYTVVSTAQ